MRSIPKVGYAFTQDNRNNIRALILRNHEPYSITCYQYGFHRTDGKRIMIATIRELEATNWLTPSVFVRLKLKKDLNTL